MTVANVGGQRPPLRAVQTASLCQITVVGPALPLAISSAVRCCRAGITRRGQFDKANPRSAQQDEPGLGCPERRATSDEEIHLNAAVDQNNPAANSTVRLVLCGSNVSELPQNYQAWYRDRLLAKRLCADGRAS